MKKMPVLARLFGLAMLVMTSVPVMAQSLTMSTVAGHRGDTVEIDVWFEAGPQDVLAYQMDVEFEPHVFQLVAIDRGDGNCFHHPEGRLIAIDDNRFLRPLSSHRVCRVGVRILDTARAGMYSHRITYTEMIDLALAPVPNAVFDAGGIFVLDSDAAVCRLGAGTQAPDQLPQHAPLCRCLASADHPSHRCDFRLRESVIVLREFPPVPVPGLHMVRWTVLPLAEGLPEMRLDMQSLSGDLQAEPLKIGKHPTPMKPIIVETKLFIGDDKALERIALDLELGDERARFETRLPGRAKP
jgi:hypothetical protein